MDTTLATTSSAVLLHDVYVTAIAGNATSPSQYWVADSLTAAANGGVLVFSKPPTVATVGQQISTLQGLAGTLTGTGVIVPLAGIATDTLSGATTGAPYNGSVVMLSKAKMMDDEAFKFYGGSSASPTPPGIDSCLIVTGVMEANTNDLIRTINPRSASDMVTATGCP